MIGDHGPSIIFLPSPRLDSKSIEKAAGMMGQLASDLGVSGKQIRDQARAVIEADLEDRGELDRFTGLLSGSTTA
jgi:hypothetical protein